MTRHDPPTRDATGNYAMTHNDTPAQEGLVPDRHRALTEPSQALVRRGLQDLAAPVITPELLRELSESIEGWKFDERLKAAQTIIRVAPHLSIEDETVGLLVCALVRILGRLTSAPGDHTFYVVTDSGRQRYLDRLDVFTAAFQALVGPDATLEDAILHVLGRGQGRARATAAYELVTSHLPKDRARPFLESALQEAPDEVQALFLRCALAYISNQSADSLYLDLVNYSVGSPDHDRDSRDRALCNGFLVRLGQHVSSETAVFSCCTLALGRDLIARLFAPDLFLDGFPPSLATDCSDNDWQLMTRVAWTSFLSFAGIKPDSVRLSPARQPSEVRMFVDRVADPYSRPTPANPSITERWRRVLVPLLDARFPSEGSQNP